MSTLNNYPHTVEFFFLRNDLLSIYFSKTSHAQFFFLSKNSFFLFLDKRFDSVILESTGDLETKTVNCANYGFKQARNGLKDSFIRFG
jgi:hypothetical protein